LFTKLSFKMKNLAFLFLAFTVFVFACNCNDDDGPTLITPATEYLPLTVGNYWIYQWYKIDESGNETQHGNYLDSIYISGDTVINGFTYSIIKGKEFNAPIERFYRDSSGYLVSATNNIPLFSTISTTEQLGIDTIFTETGPLVMLAYSMQNPTPSITVPAGTFSNCLTTLTSLTSFEEDYEYGVRNYPYQYAEGVGRVQHKISFYSSGEYYESRLVRYHVE
jgi:hypothetical protein